MSDSHEYNPTEEYDDRYDSNRYRGGGGGGGRGQRNSSRGGNRWDEGGQSNSYRNDRGNWRQRNEGRGHRESNSDFSGSDATAIEVPSTVVGRIIGRGGSKIRELESETSASIKVIRNYDNEPVTKIELRGTTEAVEDAKSKIESLIAEQDSNRY